MKSRRKRINQGALILHVFKKAGGNMYLNGNKRQMVKIITIGVSFVFLFSSTFLKYAFAGRSNAGGGDNAEFDVGKVAMSAGIAIGGAVVGSAIGAGLSSMSTGADSGVGMSTSSISLSDQLTGIDSLQSIGAASDTSLATTSALTSTASIGADSPTFLSNMGDALGKSLSFNNLAGNFATFSAESQAGRAVGNAGQYYGWDPSTTYLVSSVVSGAVGGALNPSVVLGENSGMSLTTMGKGAAVGALAGYAKGETIVSMDGDRMDNKNLPNEERQPGIAAQIAGMAVGVAAVNLGRVAVEPRTYTDYKIAETKTGPSVTDIAGRLATGTFVKTVDMWPELGAKAASITAGHYAGSEYGSTVEGITQGLASAAFSGAQKYFGLQPGLYVGEGHEGRYKEYLGGIKQEIERQYVKAHEEGNQQELSGKLKEINDAATIGEALDKAGTNRLEVIARNTSLKEIGFGLAHGGANGVTSYLVSKVSKDPQAQAAAAYGAVLFTGALRGAIQKAMWEPDRQEQTGGKKIVKIPVTETLPDGSVLQVGEKVEIQPETISQKLKAEQITPGYSDAMKNYGTAILTSMSKANTDFLDTVFSFSAPRANPKNIDALMVVNYLDNLNSYARKAAQGPGWFAGALTQGITEAGSSPKGSVTASNVVSSLGATPLGKYLNIAPYTYNAVPESGKTYDEPARKKGLSSK